MLEEAAAAGVSILLEGGVRRRSYTLSHANVHMQSRHVEVCMEMAANANFPSRMKMKSIINVSSIKRMGIGVTH